jgi:putative DNA primase/helicase
MLRVFEMKKPAQAVKEHPDLAPAFGVIDAAKKFAEEKLPPGARDEFVGIARHHVIQKITAGEVVKGPRIYLSADETKDHNSPTESATANTVDRGKPPRVKEVARDG